MRVSGEMLEMERVDADLYRQGRDDDLRALQDNFLTLEIPTTAAVGGKHIQGFAIAHVGGQCHWCWDGIWEGQSPGHTTTHDSECNFEPCIIMVQRPWSTRRKDTRMGRARGFFQRRSRWDCARASWTRRVSTWSLLVAAESFVWDKNALTQNGESGTETSCDGLGWLGVSEKRLRLRFARQRPGDASAECHCGDFVAEANLILMSCYDGSSK